MACRDITFEGWLILMGYEITSEMLGGGRGGRGVGGVVAGKKGEYKCIYMPSPPKLPEYIYVQDHIC